MKLVKSWFCPPLAYELDKTASYKGLVFHTKVAVKGLSGGKKLLQLLICPLEFKPQISEAFLVVYLNTLTQNQKMV